MKSAKHFGCDAIFQVGDFGWWPHVDEDYPKYAAQYVTDAGLTAYWIDGNHENFDDLLAMKPNEDGLVECGPGLFYVPRGTAWEWNGVRFLALGGAYSIDKHHRTPGMSWWEQELIRTEDVDKALDAGEVDIMFTHDSPIFPPGLPESYKADSFSAGNRKAVAAVVESAKPKLLFHGHYHHRHTTPWNGTLIEGLSQDGDPQSLKILDLAEFKKELAA